jgi:hypothetical protein
VLHLDIFFSAAPFSGLKRRHDFDNLCSLRICKLTPVPIQAHGPLKLVGLDETAMRERGTGETFTLKEEEKKDTQ